jgi:BASS family bile acid:Na+ symporter
MATAVIHPAHQSHGPIELAQEACAFVRRHLLAFLLLMCVMGAAWPRGGIALHETRIAGALQSSTLLLAVLLFQAGFSLELRKTRAGLCEIGILLLTVILNASVPLLLAALLSLLRLPAPLTVGLILIASLPIAGSSIAWSEQGGGSRAASLLLVLISTTSGIALSSLVFRLGAQLAPGLSHGAMAAHTAGALLPMFFLLAVLLPTVTGIIVRATAPRSYLSALRTVLRLLALLSLLALNYSNAAVAFPRVIAHPDPARLGAIVGTVVLLSIASFAAGWWMPSLFGRGADKPLRVSTMFGVGMNNNGAGLVLASIALPFAPDVLVFVLLYNLAQHLAAGLCQAVLCRSAPREFESPAARPAGRPPGAASSES